VPRSVDKDATTGGVVAIDVFHPFQNCRSYLTYFAQRMGEVRSPYIVVRGFYVCV